MQTAILVTPAQRGSRSGNRITALRWAMMLRHLGLSTRVQQTWNGQACDLLIAVHAVKSRDSLLACAQSQPHTKRVVLLAGTDIYPEFAPEPRTLQALECCDAIVALQPLASAVLPAHLRGRTRTIVQSATSRPAARQRGTFTACVLAHLRLVKDPLLPFAALAHVPKEVPLTIVVAGRAITPELGERAHEAMARDGRARWLGELPRREALQLLAGSHLCIVPSAAEGGANVVSEAIAAGTPVVATDIPGNTGLLGADWPALFPPHDAAALGAILRRCASDSLHYQELITRTLALQHLVAPARELAAWQALLQDLGLRS